MNGGDGHGRHAGRVLHEDGLRAWAAGDRSVEAAVELLIRAGYADPARPWVHVDEAAGRPWIDFAGIPELLDSMPAGQVGLLRLAASIGGGVPVILGDELAELGRPALRLVLAALAHGAGADEPGMGVRAGPCGIPQIAAVPAAYTWEQAEQGVL